MSRLFKLISYVSAFLLCISCLQEERSPEEILVPTPAQVECSDESLMLTSKVPSGSEKLVKECGFYYSKDKSMADTRKVAGVLAANNFTAELPERAYGTTYYICSYVTNGHGSEIRSDLRSYTLDELDDYVEFGALNMLSYDKNSSTLEITIDADIWGGVKISEIGVCYGDAPTGLDVDGPHKEGVWSRKQTKGDAGVVTISIDGLSDATQYYFRGYLKDDDYISYSDVLPFYIPAIPAVQTGVVEDITPYTAVLYGEVLDECGSPVSERGFVWNEGTVAPTIESDKVVVDGALGVMSATAEGLLPNRTYTFCAYAVNASGIAYGAPVTFTTLVTLPYLSTTAVSSITSNSASFSGTVNNDGGETVSEVGFYYSIDSAVDPETSEKVSMEYADYQRSAAEYSANMLYSMMSASAETPSMSSGVETKAASDGYSFSLDVYGLALKTRYYVKAYAVNSAGVAYGKVANFETMGEIPTVKTTGSSEITTSSALLSGEVVSENGEKVTERGFVWMEGTGTPTTESNKVKVDGTTGAFTHVLADLQPNKKYSFRAYAVNAEGAAYGDVVNFTTKVALPALSGIVISSITSTSATLSCKVANHGGETVTEVGFYYSTDESLNLETAIKVSLLYSDDSFSADIANLLVNTKYYVKSYAKNSAGTEYSEVETFTTSVSSPAVKTTGSSEITSTSALLSGMVVSDNGAAITERGFVWLQGTGVPTTDSFKLKTDGTTGEYTATLEGLEPNQMYSFRAYAINSKGTSYGDIMYFSTIVGVPVLSNVDVSDITATSALFTADVKDKGGEDVTEVGFYYSTEESVDIETAVKVKKNYIGTAFSASLSELQIFTTYYVKAYAINSAGVAYSNVVSFKTLASTPVVSTVGASEITPASAVLSGSVVTDNGAEITERGFVYLKGNEAPTTSSNKIKVEGTLGDFTASLADLEPNQKYSFRAYAINAKGTSYGDIMNFSTIVNLPTLAAMKVTDINTTSARFTCTVTNHGGETVSEVGFYYGKDEDVNAETALKISEEYTSDSFSLTAKELEIGQDYFVKAYTKNSVGESYSSVIKFKTTSTAPTVNTVGYTKLTATSAELSGDVADDNGEPITERGFVWIKGAGTPTTSSSKLPVEGTIGEYTAIITDLEPNQTYSYRAYAINSRGTSYGEVMQFEISVSLPTVTTNDVTSITNTSATTGGVITSDGGGEILAKGIVWSTTKNPTIETSNYTDEGEDVESFTSRLTELRPGFTYYVRAYATNIMGTVYGEEKQFITSGEIQSIPLEASNSFIISYSDVYSFQTVKGHSSESVGSVASAEVLWESFGTNEQPEIGSLVSFVTYKNGRISFATADIFREGNAVIAAKDASGTILWSWHIWLTDQPQEHIYNNYAGTMMDRNLGATSATPGDVGALGLLYQWGRKDPFLGSSINTYSKASSSTITWPTVEESDISIGTIEYAVANPTTFITGNSSNYDWHYTGSSNTDDTRWQSDKTIYDPCPIGWRVPDGGEDSVWSTAGFSSTTYDSANEGISFSISSPSTTWYPASGSRFSGSGNLEFVGDRGRYWSLTPGDRYYSYYMYLYDSGTVSIVDDGVRSSAFSVRCQKEGTGGGPKYDNDFSTSGARSLSSAGTANSYIVSGAGVYSISAVKGNSLESVGSVVSAEVLWESIGTDEKIFKGTLVSGARYENGEIYFKTADSFREGNAVIAAKDASGTILWSWHIWLTDQPQEQVYYNNAGTMMDRNLGATSATPGDVGALGLLYQWGRKDPFLSGSSVNSYNKVASSTITWPSSVSSNSSNGTIEYAIANPTTFIAYNINNSDWYYTGSSSTDDTRWQSDKTIYDPCPIGWRVPDGGEFGVWSHALGSSSSYSGTYDSSNEGVNFSSKLGDVSTIWYPASGYCSNGAGVLTHVGDYGHYWSVTPYNNKAYHMYFNYNGDVYPSNGDDRAYGLGVRCQKEGTGGSGNDGFSISGARSLSSAGTANSYIVSGAGVYSISPVKGNSLESVGSVVSAEVLWESLGTDEKIFKGTLVSGARYENGEIYFKTADSFREGNAVIAAKDASGTILWSWHIWLTDQPQEHVYNNNAGTIMDRNLGATSATPGDVCALGLLYQWGRKDPFLGSSSISSNIEAKSTITWPSSVSSNSSNGTIEYATANPTTFIAYNSNNSDWYYTGSSSTDDTRWQSDKTIYDPCPIGWRVPDGGEYGVWSNALGLSSSYSGTYDSTNEGMNFSSKLGDASTIWYPASGYRNNGGGAPTYVGDYGRYWSVTPYSNDAYYLNFNNDGDVYPSNGYDRVYGLGVRCQKEGTGGGPMYDNNFSTSGARSLSSAGTANSYIVSGAGVYSISAVKGNSLESVGSVASAEVLWESFGTDEKIFKSNLVSGVRYENGEIYFKTADSYREGNAVIAAKDATGTILWSWHIWLTDQPQELVYKNDAGTMMDRNLGAISASPGDVGALGLFYQWGRKDPFLGSSSIKEDKLAESTMQWPKAVVSSESLGTIEYSISNPTTFISKDEIYNNGDWYYTGSTSTDDTRWQAKKTIYDPCPVGWHVPEIKVWSLADFDGLLLDGLNIGISFPVDDSTTTWYPAAGYRDYNAGSLYVVVKHGYYWSVTTSGKTAYRLDFANSGYSRFLTSSRGQGYSVRCQKE